MQWTSEELPCHQEMHDLAEQSRSPILNHQSHLCTHKHPPGGSHLTSFYISKNNKTVVAMRSRRCRCITITSLARLACFITDAACCKETKKQRNNAWWSKTPYIIAGMDEAEGRKKGRKKKKKVPEEWASNRFAAENRAGSIIAKQVDLLRAPNPTSSLPEP